MDLGAGVQKTGELYRASKTAARCDDDGDHIVGEVVPQIKCQHPKFTTQIIPSFSNSTLPTLRLWAMSGKYLSQIKRGLVNNRNTKL